MTRSGAPPSGDRAVDMWARDMRLIATDRDRDAFARVFDHFSPRVKAFAMRSNIGAEMAEEIAQETLMMAWRKADTYQAGKATVSTWLFTICRNKLIDRLRRENRPEPDPNDPAFVGDAPPSQDETVSAAQEAHRLRTAVAQLPRDQREAVTLSFFAGYAHPEIAQRLDVPIGTVKSRIRLALAKLRSMLNVDEI